MLRKRFERGAEKMKKVVTIAGSDATGGGGLEADLKIFQEFGTFGLAAITSIVTLDPTDGSHAVALLDLAVIEKQLASVFAGPIDAIKTGLLPTTEIIELIAAKLTNRQEKIVVDPVIGGKKTQDFIGQANIQALQQKLLPQAFITTPNLREAAILSELGEIKNRRQMTQAAEKIARLGPKRVVIKGGTRLVEETGETVDLYYDGTSHFYPHPLIKTENNHGAGCTFAAAVTAGLAKRAAPQAVVEKAIEFTEAAIKAGVTINPYTGHVWHGAYHHAEKRMEEF